MDKYFTDFFINDVSIYITKDRKFYYVELKKHYTKYRYMTVMLKIPIFLYPPKLMRKDYGKFTDWIYNIVKKTVSENIFKYYRGSYKGFLKFLKPKIKISE